MSEETKTWMSAEAAAAALGTTALNVLMQIKRGRLEGREDNGRWFVSAASLSAFDAPKHEGGGACGGCGGCGAGEK